MGHQFGGEESPVGLLQTIFRHNGGQDRQGGVGEESFGRPQKEEDSVYQGHARPPAQHRKAQNPYDARPEEVHHRHKTSSVEAVYYSGLR
jgi:hypothetical protein